MADIFRLHSNRDYAPIIIGNLSPGYCDIDAQLKAIQKILNILRKSENSDNTMLFEKFPEEYSEEIVHQSVYNSSAYSMAAISMIAPFIEMLFHRLFNDRNCRERFMKVADKNHVRWKLDEADHWSLCYWYDVSMNSGKYKQKSTYKSIIQICEAIDLTPYLPNDFDKVIKIVFEYRNTMFHNGFEWPLNKRKKFQEMIKNMSCPISWIDLATSGREPNQEPWAFYLSEEFIKHCMNNIEKTLEGIGAYDRWIDTQT